MFGPHGNHGAEESGGTLSPVLSRLSCLVCQKGAVGQGRPTPARSIGLYGRARLGSVLMEGGKTHRSLTSSNRVYLCLADLSGLGSLRLSHWRNLLGANLFLCRRVFVSVWLVFIGCINPLIFVGCQLVESRDSLPEFRFGLRTLWKDQSSGKHILFDFVWPIHLGSDERFLHFLGNCLRIEPQGLSMRGHLKLSEIWNLGNRLLTPD